MIKLGNITYIQGDLFELAPETAFLAHSCNCQGVWGSGIAVEFRKRFPEVYKNYVGYCLDFGPNRSIGRVYGEGKIISLLVSKDYGKHRDQPLEILSNTRKALTFLITYWPEIKEIHMPKINSGLFAVPWYDTEMVLKEFDSQLNFVVYELEK